MGTVSPVCRQQAEFLFLDQCVCFCRKGADPSSEYYRYAKNMFLDYLGKHGILSNRAMKPKHKLFFYMNRLRLARERGDSVG